MSEDRIDANVTAMARFAANLLASAQKETPASIVRAEGCGHAGGGMAECSALITADAETTHKIRQLITHTQQGFTGYANFARTSGVEYLNADDNARRVMLDALRAHRGQGIPDVSPALLPPQEA